MKGKTVSRCISAFNLLNSLIFWIMAQQDKDLYYILVAILLALVAILFWLMSCGGEQ